jgi:hypothetical protein
MEAIPVSWELRAPVARSDEPSISVPPVVPFCDERGRTDVKTPKYSFQVVWSDDDEGFVATCPEFKGVSGPHSV